MRSKSPSRILATTPNRAAVLTAEEENESFRVSSFNIGRTGTELPVEFELLDNGLGPRQALQLLRQRLADSAVVGTHAADAQRKRDSLA
jgi:hypothetical protein